MDFCAVNFLERVIAMNFTNTPHAVLERKVPTIAMSNPPVQFSLYMKMSKTSTHF